MYQRMLSLSTFSVGMLGYKSCTCSSVSSSLCPSWFCHSLSPADSERGGFENKLAPETLLQHRTAHTHRMRYFPFTRNSVPRLLTRCTWNVLCLESTTAVTGPADATATCRSASRPRRILIIPDKKAKNYHPTFTLTCVSWTLHTHTYPHYNSNRKACLTCALSSNMPRRELAEILLE